MTHILELLDVEQELRRDSRPTRQQRLLLLPFHPIINHSLLPYSQMMMDRDDVYAP